jgi:hypothetical protein
MHLSSRLCLDARISTRNRQAPAAPLIGLYRSIDYGGIARFPRNTDFAPSAGVITASLRRKASARSKHAIDAETQQI